MKEEKFPNRLKSSHTRVCGEFWNLRGQHNWEGKKKKKAPQNRRLTATASGEVAQTHAYHQRAGAGQGGAVCIIRA